MKIFRWLIAIYSLVLTAALALAATVPGKKITVTKVMSQKVLNANAWEIYTTNYGPFVKPQTGSGAFWPAGSGRGYIYGAGLWVGAQDTAGNKIVAAGFNGSGGHEFGPVSLDNSYEDYLTDPLARVYLSTDPTDLYYWPVLDSAGNKVVRSRQDSYCKYSDQNPDFTFSGDSTLGILVEQFSYAWNYADNNDIVFFYFKIKNLSDQILDKAYTGPYADCDIGDESGTSGNDRTIFDYQRNLAIQFQSEPESGWPETGMVGFRYFESPINNTGATVHVVDNQFAHDILPGSALGLTAFKIVTLQTAPSTDAERYLMMSGLDQWGMVMDAYDEWGAITPADKRFIMSSGPFVLKPDSTVTTCIGIIGALDTTALKTASDVAQTIYDNGFALADPPASPSFVFTATAGDGKACLSWNKAVETTPDPYWAMLADVKSWNTYFPGSWSKLSSASQLLVDSFEVKDKLSTSYIRIARDAAQPANGGDTVNAFYNHRSLYEPYDFQGYLVYRAASLADLADPSKRSPVGSVNYGTSGAFGYFYDKVDGYQIVLDIGKNIYATPDTVYYLPKYDTLGTDRGLAYCLIDSGLINGQTYYYSVVAYDYQPNVYFTHKCPTTMSSDPLAIARSVVPLANDPGYIPPNISIRVDGGSDIRYGGTTDYFYNATVGNPSAVQNDSFKIHWNPVQKVVSGLNRNPHYTGKLYSSGNVLLDSVGIIPSWSSGYYGYTFIPYGIFSGPAYSQLPFGGIALQPYYTFDKYDADIDSFNISENPSGSRTYPLDSVSVIFNTGIFSEYVCLWQWRGSDFEIRWKDTLTGLTAEVWDLTNNILVPLETGVTKANMTQSSWCFNPTSSTSSAWIATSTSADAYGMQICGITVYFNKPYITLRRMDWPNRPETGDIWRIYCSGPRPPIEGDIATVFTYAEGAGGTHSGSALSFFLAQNAPNPFGHSGTNISYQIGGNGPVPVSLKIYNITGQLVKTLVNVNKTPGYYNATWDGRSDKGQKVSAGIYIYRLQAGEKNITRKMVLIK
ncbi:MAG: T9SS type A sorting domain-containing protein [Candidatus Edwardsbacteria bacterium]|nr:T9SS type A sorting domain-containing protein [Candidatus Edwardsbacteria bacterium]